MTYRIHSLLPADDVLLNAYIPTPLTGSVWKEDIQLTLNKGDHTRLHTKKNHYRFTHSSESFPQDAYHLLGAITRKHWLMCGIYSTHAACIDGHLLVGHSGSGKTSVILALLAQGMKNLIATNVTLLSPDKLLTAWGGTRAITLEVADSPAQQGKVYGNRLAFMPSADVLATTPQPIKAVWFVQLDARGHKVENLSSLSCAHRLYPMMMNRVNADILLGGGADLFLYNDSDASRKLAKALPHCLRSLPAMHIAGTANSIAQHIMTWGEKA